MLALLTRGARQAMHARRYRPLSALALEKGPPTAPAGAATSAYSMAPTSTSRFRLGRPFSVLLPSPLRVTYAETSSPRDLSTRVCFLSSQGRPRPHRNGGSGPRRHGQKGGSRNLKRGHARGTQRGGRTLDQLVQDNNFEEAWRMFYDLMESGEIDVEDCNTMLKACHSAAQMRELIDVTMAKAKLKPNVVTYNTLVSTLRMEGDDAAAESVVEEMKKAGVKPNGYTQEMLNYPLRGENLSRMRNSKLSQFWKQGGDEATVAARSMMDKMVEHGVAHVHLFTVMLKFCKSSGEMREVIDVMMAKAKLKPNVVTYTTLLGMLRMEGDDAAAESVVEEMKKAGVQPNVYTQEILNYPSRGENLSKMRTSRLSQFWKQGGDEATVAARSMMDKMVEHGVADIYLFAVMLKFCKSSGETREVIDVMMAKAKLKPDVVTYNTLVGRLRMDGDDAAAESVVEEMKKVGVEPNGRTQEMLNLPSRGERLSNMRTSKIRELLQQGREGEKAAAKLCRDLHERRLMPNTIILQMMIDHCVNSDFEWPVAADEGALMWYYMGKSSNAPKIRVQHNREVIDLHNCSRGLASVTLVDRLLLLRSKWIEADPDADIVKGGVLVIVGKGKGTGTTSTSSEFKSTVPVLKGAAMRLLNGRLNLSAVVNPLNRGSLLIEKENLLRWFESEQASEWSKEISKLKPSWR